MSGRSTPPPLGRRLAAEFVGTALLVVAVVGSGIAASRMSPGDVGLELEWVGTTRVRRARRGTPTVRLSGLPGELLLYLFGRQGAAKVEVSGSMGLTTWAAFSA